MIGSSAADVVARQQTRRSNRRAQPARILISV
jgi:hypothetical protein